MINFLFTLCTVAIMFSSEVYATGDHENTSAKNKLHHWNAPAQMTERVNPMKRTTESLQRGKELYKKNCISCHGDEGRGDGPVASALKQKPADLVAMAGHHTGGDFAWKIAEGRGAMPGWKESLTEEQIWDLVNFIQNLEKRVPNKGTMNNIKH